MNRSTTKPKRGAMPTDVFGRGHVVIDYQHAHEDVGMAPEVYMRNSK